MIVGDLKSSTSKRRYHKDSREVKLIHTKPLQPLCWSEQPITLSLESSTSSRIEGSSCRMCPEMLLNLSTSQEVE
jgi:hypothetical protein